MSDHGPRSGGDENHWPDRDTEPIPRARHQPESGRHAAADADPADEAADPAGHDPDFAAAASVAPEPEPAPEPAPRADRPRPSPRREPPAEPELGEDPDEFVRVGGDYDGRGQPYDDDATLPHNFPDDLAGDRSRYASGSLGVPYIDGEPLTEEELGGLRGGTTPLVTSRRVVPLEDEPSALVQRYLFPTEKFRGEWKRHPIELAKEIGIAVGVTIVVGLLAGYLARAEVGDEIAGVLVIGWLGVVVWAAWQIVDWWYDRFILTNKRVMVVSGIITRNVAMMPLQRVTDMKYVQSALGRVLNYGTFELESAGQDQALRSIPHLPSPNELYLRIVEEMYEPEAVEARLAGAQDVIDDGT
jgi:hypothetical protein